MPVDPIVRPRASLPHPEDPPPPMPTTVGGEHARARPSDLETAAGIDSEIVSAHVAEFVADALLEEGLTIGGTTVAVGGAVLTIATMGAAVVRAPIDGERDALLFGALGGSIDSPESRAWAAGLGAVLSGMGLRDYQALRASIPEGHARRDFDAAVRHAQSLEGDIAFAEARDRYLVILRDAGDGEAAAIGGWDDPARGEMFDAARQRMAHTLEADPEQRRELESRYRAGFHEGFRAAHGFDIDSQRMRFDPAYRAGVMQEQRLDREGRDADIADTLGRPASSYQTFAPIRG